MLCYSTLRTSRATKNVTKVLLYNGAVPYEWISLQRIFFQILTFGLSNKLFGTLSVMGIFLVYNQFKDREWK